MPLLWLVPAVLAGLTHAAGPARVATGNRQLWPTPVNTVAEFDQASRAALAVYRQTLQGWAGQSDAQLQALVHTQTLEPGLRRSMGLNWWIIYIRRMSIIPTIFITSLTLKLMNLERGYEKGCCDYIKKPFDLSELRLRVAIRVTNIGFKHAK